jgi:hypothetical protein
MLALQSEGFRPVMVSRDRAGFTLNIIDTPGLVEGGYVNYQALELIKRLVLLESYVLSSLGFLPNYYFCCSFF